MRRTPLPERARADGLGPEVAVELRVRPAHRQAMRRDDHGHDGDGAGDGDDDRTTGAKRRLRTRPDRGQKPPTTAAPARSTSPRSTALGTRRHGTT